MRSEVRNLPEIFLQRLQQIVPPQKWDAVANTFTEPKPTTFRANSLKVSPAVVRERLEHQEFSLEPIHWYPDAFLLRRGTLRDLQKTDTYLKGEIYVQSLSSMLPPLVLNPQPEELILDMTAAPGSKTTQIGCLMKGQGRIVANDNNRPRFFMLKANVETQGIPNVELTLQYGETIGRRQPERFDRILLDAPCSAEGRFQTREPKSYGFWKENKIKEMVRKQKKLLWSAIGALRPGGVLVYSTCTFAPEENEGILSWALEKFGDVVQLEPIQLPMTNQMLPLTRWGKEEFNPAVRKSIRILPTPQMDGFFVARFRKKETVIE